MSKEHKGFIYICGFHIRLSDVSEYHYEWDSGNFIVLNVSGSTLRIRADDDLEAKTWVLALTMIIGGVSDVLELAGLDK